MCASCGCGKPNDDHGDSRNITMQDLDQAAQAAGTTREGVIENMTQCEQAVSGRPATSAQAERGDYYQESRERLSGRQPGEIESEPREESSSAWQGGVPMGEMGREDIQKPQANP